MVDFDVVLRIPFERNAHRCNFTYMQNGLLRRHIIRVNAAAEQRIIPLVVERLDIILVITRLGILVVIRRSRGISDKFAVAVQIISVNADIIA